MSAIEPLGYPDWQRLTNWDGPVLWSLTPGVYNAVQSSPVVRVDRFQAVGGVFNFSGGACQIQFNWYADVAKTTLLGTRAYIIGPTGSPYLQYRAVNKGAWLQVIMTPIGGSFTANNPCALAATNRAYPSETAPGVPVLLSTQGFAVAAGGYPLQFIQPVYAGPAMIHLVYSQPNCGIDLFAYNAAGVWDQIGGAGVDAVHYINQLVHLPTQSIRANFWNASGVAATVSGYIVTQ